MNFQDNRFCVYLHKRKEDQTVVYIGHGRNDPVKPRFKDKTNRSTRHLDEWDDLEKIVIIDHLSKEDATNLENDLLNDISNLSKYYQDFKFIEFYNIQKKSSYTFKISYEYIKTKVKIDEESPSGLSWILENKQSFKDRLFAGTKDNNGYWRVSIDKIFYKVHRLVMCLKLQSDLDTNLVVNHKDSNPSNNSVSNLELVSQSENVRKKKINRNNTSGYTGISWKESRNCWLVRYYEKSGKEICKYLHPLKIFPLAPSFDEAKKLTLSYAIKYREELISQL